MHDPHPDTTILPRRELLGTTLAALGGFGLASCAGPRAAAASKESSGQSKSLITRGDTVLFQGDSITDAGRSREHAHEANTQSALGSGYAWLASSGLLVNHPQDDLEIFNRGISGNKVFQLAERWDVDCLALKPDVLSILIGVNDIWHARGGNYDGTVEVYERDYDALLQRTRASLPEVALVLCEPFVLRCGAIDDSWFPEFDEYRAAARRVAVAHAATWVPFQAMFDQAIRYAPPEHWANSTLR